MTEGLRSHLRMPDPCQHALDQQKLPGFPTPASDKNPKGCYEATPIETKAEAASVHWRTHEDAHGKKKENLEVTNPGNTGW